jgi:hypothetical protein
MLCFRAMKSRRYFALACFLEASRAAAGATIWLHNADVVTSLRRAGSEEFLIAVNLPNTPFRGSVEAAGNWEEVELPVSKPESEAVPFLSLNAFEARIFQKQAR